MKRKNDNFQTCCLSFQVDYLDSVINKEKIFIEYKINNVIKLKWIACNDCHETLQSWRKCEKKSQ